MKRMSLVYGCAALLGLAGACGDETMSSGAATSASSSSGTGGMGGSGGGEPACVSMPTTHVEIINACTDAEKIDKMVKLPLLNADGSLPPLP